MKKKWIDVFVIFGILAAALAVRILFFGKEAVWLDEAMSLNYAGSDGFFGVIKSVIENKDAHPPFYYLLLHFWQWIFGNGEVWARILSVVFGMGAVFMMYLLGFKIHGRKFAIFSSLMIALLFFPVFYSLEIRMYSLVLFLMIVSLYLLWDLIEKFVWWKNILFIFVCAILLYTHYFSFFWVTFLFLFWVINGAKIWRWISSAGALIVLYLPWIFVFVQQFFLTISGGVENNLRWISLPEPSYKIFKILAEEFFYFQGAFGRFGLLAFVCGILCVAILFLVVLFGKKKIFGRKFVWFFGLGILLNLIFPYLFSIFVEPIIHPRYLQGAFLIFVILIGFLVTQFRSKIVYGTLVTLFVCFSSLILWRAGGRLFHPDWNGFFEKYSAEFTDDATVFVSPKYYEIELKYYFEKLGIKSSIKTFDFERDDLNEVFGGRKFIFVERLAVKKVVDYLFENCNVEKNENFERVGFYEGRCK